jgi:hypothetical protein
VFPAFETGDSKVARTRRLESLRYGRNQIRSDIRPKEGLPGTFIAVKMP